MRIWTNLAIVAIATFLPSIASAQQSFPPFHDGRPVVAGPDPMVLGTYDPHGDFTNDPVPKIEHLLAGLRAAGASFATGADFEDRLIDHGAYPPRKHEPVDLGNGVE